jgi:hypothetical protein
VSGKWNHCDPFAGNYLYREPLYRFVRSTGRWGSGSFF